MSESTEKTKKIWTESERLALAAKLDEELDDFIEGLEKKRYAEGWPEDRWEEEMDKHPFFMKKVPEPGDEVHPMFEGLQKLKYDPQENTNEELALNYKEDGNFYMKHKKFRMAVYSFTEALQAKCDKPDLIAAIYNNRSAAHFFIKNHRSALSDAQKALQYKPDYAKARWRAAQCAYEVEKFDLCTELCNALLEDTTYNKQAMNLLIKNKAKKLEGERDNRKQLMDVKKRQEEFNKLCVALRGRGVKFDDMKINDSITEDLLRPKFLPLEDHAVHFIENIKMLVWPAAFSYPEFQISEFQQMLSENETMLEVLTEMYKDPMPWDNHNSYNINSVNVYYENRKVGCVHKVDLNKTIKEIMQEKSFFVTGGSLLFYVVTKESNIEKTFILEQRRPLVF